MIKLWRKFKIWLRVKFGRNQIVFVGCDLSQLPKNAMVADSIQEAVDAGLQAGDIVYVSNKTATTLVDCKFSKALGEGE